MIIGDDFQPLRSNLPFYGREPGFEKIALVSTRDEKVMSLLQEYGFEIHYREFTVHSDQRNHLLEIVGPRWLLQLDADERPEPKLLAEVQALAGQSGAKDNLYIAARCNYFMNRFMRYGKQYPDYQKRFFFNDGPHYEGMVHEILIHSKRVVPLEGRILHYSDDDISTRLFKMVVYSLYEAEGKERNPTLAGLLFKPPILFLVRLLKDRAFLDGIAGIVWLVQSTICYQLEYLISYYWHRKKAALATQGWNGASPTQSIMESSEQEGAVQTNWADCFRPPATASRERS